MTTVDEYKARRAKLVAALRSGDYKQTRGALQRRAADEDGPVGFCCLGVAEDVRGCTWVETDDKRWVGIEVDGQDYPETSTLTPEGMEYYGFASASGLMDGLDSLIGMNDNGASFADIVGVIESNPKGLWKEGTY